MKIDPIVFYKVQKNEDANPFVNIDEHSGFIAAADGLGGSGSCVHVLSSYNDKLEKHFKKTFLPEYFNGNYNESHDEKFKSWGKFKCWINLLIAPVVDDTPDTSALWGSRIAIARFVHYLLYQKRDVDLSDENARQDIVKYIYSGMTDTVREFRLKTDSNGAQLRLPTTIVGLRYKIVDDEQIFVETVWAGDSRAYAIVPDLGLKQLSRDDEDGSGAISNLFCINENGEVSNTKLNYASYILPKKSIVFVCSDGIFDPYEPIDNIGVEAVFLDCVSRSNGFEELGRNWAEHFEPMTHDDCSVAFLAFGYDSFAELKTLFARRKEEVSTMFNDYSDLKRFIQVIEEGSGEDPENYIRERAKARIKEIAEKFATEIITNPNSTNDLIVPKLYEIYGKLQHEILETSKQKEGRAKDEAGKKVQDYLLDNADKMRDIFRQNAPGGLLLKSIVAVANSLTASRGELKKAEEECRKNDQRLIDALAVRDQLTTSLCNRRGEINTTLCDYGEACKWGDLIFQAHVKGCGDTHEETLQQQEYIDYLQAQRKTVQNYDKALSNLIEFLKGEKIPRNYSFVCYPLDKHFMKEVEDAIKEIVASRKSKESAEKIRKKAQETSDPVLHNYRQAVLQFLDKSLRSLIDEPNKWFSDWACTEFGLPIRSKIEPVKVDVLKGEILNYFIENEKEFNELIRKFMDSSSPSIIDSLFNERRLSLYRECKSVDFDRVREVRDKADKLIREGTNVTAILPEKELMRGTRENVSRRKF